MTKHLPSCAHRILPVALALAAALPPVACDSLLDVNDPDIVTPDDLTGDLGLATLRNGALSAFQEAWSAGGESDNVVMASGLFTDEWMHSGTYVVRQEVDRRAIQGANTTMEGLYFRLQRARADLERAAVRLARSVPDPDADARIPEMLAYAGFAYVAFGENYCSGVPFSETIDSIVYGEPLTTQEILERAVTRFDAALNHPATDSGIAHLARLGKGRALLGLDRVTEAAAAVAPIPDGWARYNYHSNAEARTRNGIYALNAQGARYSMADTEGGTGLPFRIANDPRVPWIDPGRTGLDRATPLYIFSAYQDRTDRFPLASGVEARLIEAEAALRSGGNWLAILNGLRANFATLGPVLYPDHPLSGSLAALTDPGSATGREDLLFSERAFWLFSTGHRLGDLRRLVRQYGRAAEAAFPTGAYFKGGSYGTDVNFPVPQTEQNNPKFTQCLDRNP